MPNAKTKLTVLKPKEGIQMEIVILQYWVGQRQIAEMHLARIVWR